MSDSGGATRGPGASGVMGEDVAKVYDGCLLLLFVFVRLSMSIRKESSSPSLCRRYRAKISGRT